MDECGVCGQNKQAHDDPGVHHVFDLDGRLISKSARKPSTPRGGLSAGDVTLRLITVMRSKGLLTDADLGIIFTEEKHADPQPQRAPDHR